MIKYVALKTIDASNLSISSQKLFCGDQDIPTYQLIIKVCNLIGVSCYMESMLCTFDSPCNYC